MGESKIHVVDRLTRQCLRFVVTVFARRKKSCGNPGSKFSQIRSVMTFGARLFCMASLAIRFVRPEIHDAGMFLCKIRNHVRSGAQRRQIRMTCFALVARLHVVMAGVAGCHRREIFMGRKFCLVQILMAGFALHSLFRDMLFMAEKDFTNRIRQRLHIIIAGVAEITRFVHFLFVARLAFRMGREHSVRRQNTFIRLVALYAFSTGFRVFCVGEFNDLRLVDLSFFAGNDTAASEQNKSGYNHDDCRYREILFH